LSPYTNPSYSSVGRTPLVTKKIEAEHFVGKTTSLLTLTTKMARLSSNLQVRRKNGFTSWKKRAAGTYKQITHEKKGKVIFQTSTF